MRPSPVNRLSEAIGETTKVRPQMKVLLVEDDASMRNTLERTLTRRGMQLATCDDGRKALALWHAGQPDVVMLDLSLPGMDGLELARRIRSEPRHARMILIALTGYGQAADRVAAREAGFDEHLVKPVQGEQLLTLLGEMQRARPAA